MKGQQLKNLFVILLLGFFIVSCGSVNSWRGPKTQKAGKSSIRANDANLVELAALCSVIIVYGTYVGVKKLVVSVIDNHDPSYDIHCDCEFKEEDI